MPKKHKPKLIHRSPTPTAPQTPQCAAPSWLSELIHWERADYDGIKGTLPPWVPAPFVKSFSLARGSLFPLVENEKATYEDIRKQFTFMVANKYSAVVLACLNDPRPYDDALSSLVPIYKAVQLGEEEGLRQLAGDVAVAGSRARAGHTKRKAAVHKPEIQQIGTKYWATNPTAIVKDILNSTELTTYMKDKKPYAYRTFQNWLREVDPRPLSAKRGPRNQKR